LRSIAVDNWVLWITGLSSQPGDDTRRVRWERLFADLDAQFDAAERDEFDSEVADRTRCEVAQVKFADRLRSAVGADVDLTVAGCGRMVGRVSGAGVGWLMLTELSGATAIVVAPAVAAARNLGSAVTPAGAVESRLGLGHVLRIVARDRSVVTVVCRDGACQRGVIDRVGADFLDLVDRPTEQRRVGDRATPTLTVALRAVAAVRID
jgi:hypothetical protein